MTSKADDNMTMPRLRNSKVYIGDADRSTPGLQEGVFAKRPIKRGEVIFVARGTKVEMEIRTKADSRMYPNALGLKRNTWLDPYPDNALRYLNHSCDPNAGVKGSVTIVALRDIQKGEHITIDYSTTECDELWDLDTDCKCGTKRCRKVIKPIQFLAEHVYTKYLPYVPRALQREYHKAQRQKRT